MSEIRYPVQIKLESDAIRNSNIKIVETVRGEREGGDRRIKIRLMDWMLESMEERMQLSAMSR